MTFFFIRPPLETRDHYRPCFGSVKTLYKISRKVHYAMVMNKFNQRAHRLARKRAERILVQYAAGNRVMDIAQRMGISRQRVYQIIKAATSVTKGNGRAK
jgi:DNA-binding CsgD family transcriptional regulator